MLHLKHLVVENNLNAPLDIVFKEDANQTLEKMELEIWRLKKYI